MTIAVCGDVHGHLHLLFAILGRWQAESGRRLALILQVGDLGAFRSESHLDPATRRHAERDPEELGFAEFAGDHAPRTPLDPRPPLVFIPGNHEDFTLLGEAENRVAADAALYPVSKDDRIHALRSGRIAVFESGEGQLRIGGIGGADHLRRKTGRHPRCHLDAADCDALMVSGRQGFDILISHDAPEGLDPGPRRAGVCGSAAIRAVIDTVSPRLAFFGHYDHAGDWRVGATHIMGLAGCGYDRNGRITGGSIAIVEWTAEPRVERLAPEWLLTSTRGTWRHWGRKRP